MLMGDVDGALTSFDWYEDAYPDDGGEPYQYLTWSLALFRGGRRQEAINKLYQTMLENLYLVPFLIGQNPQPLDIWYGSNLGWIEYAVEVPKELLNLWDEFALKWAREVSEHPAVVEKVARYVAIHRELKSEPPGLRRSALVDKSRAEYDEKFDIVFQALDRILAMDTKESKPIGFIWPTDKPEKQD